MKAIAGLILASSFLDQFSTMEITHSLPILNLFYFFAEINKIRKFVNAVVTV